MLRYFMYEFRRMYKTNEPERTINKRIRIRTADGRSDDGDIAAALDAGDADALKSLFSKTALEEATDIDQQISDLLEFYQGKKQSFEGDASSSTHTKYGEDVEKELKGHYILITDTEQYRVAYQYKPIDKDNSDQEGLLSMEIVTDTTYQKDEFKWQYADNAGVYIQK